MTSPSYRLSVSPSTTSNVPPPLLDLPPSRARPSGKTHQTSTTRSARLRRVER